MFSHVCVALDDHERQVFAASDQSMFFLSLHKLVFTDVTNEWNGDKYGNKAFTFQG